METTSQITINGQSYSFSTPIFLKQILQQLKIDSPYIAVALNGEVVPRSLLEEKAIHAGDTIEVIRAVAGG